MKSILFVLLGGVSLYGLWKLFGPSYADDRTPLPDRYLKAMSQMEGRDGVEQSCIQQWPIRKIENAQGWRNAERLRRRA